MVLKKSPFLLFASVPLGIGLGILLHSISSGADSQVAKSLLPWVRLPGDIFLSLLQMIMVPLVISSIANGMSQLKNPDQLWGLGSRTLVYFVFTTLVATGLGILFATALLPGKQWGSQTPVTPVATPDPLSIPAVLLGIIPKNLIATLGSSSMLSIVFIGLLLGLFFLKVDSKNTASLKEFSASLESFCLWVVGFTIRLAPLAIVSLLSYSFSQMGLSLISNYLQYILTVLLGLLGLLIFYLVLVFVSTKRNPISFLSSIRSPLFLAFSTSSSSSVLPVTLSTAKENLQVQETVADFVLPLGATVNMDGTALYQAVATLFLAQIYSISLSYADLFLLLFSVTGASIGTAATPGAGIIILGSILQTFGIPLEGIAILLGVDRFLDMCRTSINVTGDLTASLVLNQWWKK